MKISSLLDRHKRACKNVAGKLYWVDLVIKSTRSQNKEEFLVNHLYFIFLGLAPAIFWMWYIYRKDVWEPEPKKQIVKIFFLGVLAIIPTGILEYVFQHNIYNITIDKMQTSLILNMVICFLVIGPIEELFKYSVVKGFMYHHKDFNEKLDGVVYMVAAAMGFSGLENVMYIANVGYHDPTQATTVAVLRGVLATPAHAIFSGFLGVFLGEAKFCGSRWKGLGLTAIGFLIATFLHGLYDTLAFAGSYYSFGVIPLLLVSGWILLRQIKRLANESPFKEGQKEQQTIAQTESKN